MTHAQQATTIKSSRCTPWFVLNRTMTGPEIRECPATPKTSMIVAAAAVTALRARGDTRTRMAERPCELDPLRRHAGARALDER
jgi:hypothetical protein